jgi:endonuclease YncB( thermonuclease family)
MTTKIVIHSNGKRLIQVICLALVIAAVLVGLKRLAALKEATTEPATPNQASVQAPQTATDEGGTIAGRAAVVDADTLEINGQRIRLEGIDAMEAAQHCTVNGKEWACGREAIAALNIWLNGRSVSCTPKGKDRYGRTLARCFVGTEDIQSWLVTNGWALAFRDYSTDFISAEDDAKERKVGVWQGGFVAPWDWRK